MLTPDLTVASLTGSGNVQLAAANLVTGYDNSNQTYSGVISGLGGVTKMGSGTWTLTSTNTYSGNTLVSQGTLQVGNNLALQNSTFDTTSPGALAFLSGVNSPVFGGLTGANNLTLPSTVTSLTLNPGSGVTQSYSGNLGGGTNMTLTMAGAGTQVLSGTNSYSGATSVNQGVLEAANTASLPGYPNYSGPNTVTVAARRHPRSAVGQWHHWLEQHPDRQPADERQLEPCTASLRHRYDHRQCHVQRKPHHAGRAEQAGGQHPDPDRNQHLLRLDHRDGRRPFRRQHGVTARVGTRQTSVSVAGGAVLAVQTSGGVTAGWSNCPDHHPSGQRQLDQFQRGLRHRYDQRQLHL